MRRFIFLIILIYSGSWSAKEADLTQIRTTVARWSEAHNRASISTFSELYAPSLLFYAKRLTQDECILIKYKQLNSAKDYNLKIITSIESTFYESGIVRCDFTKEVRIESKVTQSRSYLLLARIGNNYQIVGESDLSVDSKFNYTPDLGQKIKINELRVVDQFQKASDSTERSWLAGWVIFLTSSFMIGAFIFYRRRSDVSVHNLKYSVPVTGENYAQGITAEKDEEHNAVEQNRKLEEILNSDRFRKRNGRKMPMRQIEISPVSLKRKGDEFEAYVFERFDRRYFKIRYWNGDLSHKGYYPESNTYPDLEIEFKLKDFKRTFAVECKYRSLLINSRFELKGYNIENYRNYGKERAIRVYIALGLYGKPSNPKRLFLIPLEVFSDRNYLTLPELMKYERNTRNFHYDIQIDSLR